MKIKITYSNENELERLLSIPLRQVISNGAKVKKNTKNPPYMHCYIDLGGKAKILDK